MIEEVKKRVRGKGKKPAKVLISLRLDPDVFEFFDNIPTPNLQLKIRNALREYISIKESKND